MSKRTEPVSAEACHALGATEKRMEPYSNRELALGLMPVTRILPVRERRLVGPWCFLDRFGPLSFTNEKPRDVAPHPHIGLQTVTWLLEGEVLIGADLQLHPGHGIDIPLNPVFEHAVLTLDGDAAVDGHPLRDRTLYYLGTTRIQARVSSVRGGRLLLIGGPPFSETILMWWNFVARTTEEIAAARADWEAHHRFGDVAAYGGPRLRAPSLVRLARPEPVS